MKITREFVWADTDTFRYRRKLNSGWLLKDKPHFDPIAARGWNARPHVLVHDILEHHSEDGDGIEFEMMAFGATYFIRALGKWKKHSRLETAFDVFKSDFAYFLQKCNWTLPPIDGNIHPDLSEYYNNIIEDAFASTYSVIDIGFKWISKGYERACERWKATTSMEVCRLYECLQEELEAGPLEYQKDGWNLTVCFDTETLHHSIRYHEG